MTSKKNRRRRAEAVKLITGAAKAAKETGGVIFTSQVLEAMSKRPLNGQKRNAAVPTR